MDRVSDSYVQMICHSRLQSLFYSESHGCHSEDDDATSDLYGECDRNETFILVTFDFRTAPLTKLLSSRTKTSQ